MIKSLKIAFLHNDYPFGGAEKVTSDIARYFTSQGHRVYIFVNRLNNELLSQQDRSSIEFLQLPHRRVDNQRNAEFIAQNIRQTQIDILVVPVLMLPYFDYLRHNTSCKVVFGHHGMPFWEVRYKLDNGLRKARQGGIWKRIEWQYVKLPLERAFGRYERRFINEYKRTLRTCDAFTVLCEGYKHDIYSVTGLGEAKLFVMPNPILPHEPYATDKAKQVLYMGRLSYADKRVDRLIDIWAEVHFGHPHWELLIVGDGAEKAKLLESVRSRAIPRVTFCDHTTDPSKYYESAAILCMTSEFEGFGLVLAEAQQAGVIPIAFGCSAGVRSVIEPNGYNGVLIEPFDMEDYVLQLDWLMSDSELRRRLQTNVIQKSAEYNLERVGELWIAMFNDLLKQ